MMIIYIIQKDEGGPDLDGMKYLSGTDNVNNVEEKKCDDWMEMVPLKQVAVLKKEGYKLVGLHLFLEMKLCRWTKQASI